MEAPIDNYSCKLIEALKVLPKKNIETFFSKVLSAWQQNRQIFICGNGGSAANSIHISNDLFFGIARNEGKGIRVQALPANQSVITSLANDLSYGDVFSVQLNLLANAGDLLIVLSGSGNSPNILNALRKSKELKMLSVAILGYSGGAALELADIPIHTPVNDMQISEDIQLIVGHALMQWLSRQKLQQQG